MHVCIHETGNDSSGCRKTERDLGGGVMSFADATVHTFKKFDARLFKCLLASRPCEHHT